MIFGLKLGLFFPLVLLSYFTACQSSEKKLVLQKEQDNTYVTQVPKGEWFDTGISVGPNMQIVTATVPGTAAERFNVRVGHLNEGQADFNNGICCGLTTITPDKMNNEQLYLRVPDSVKAESLNIRISIGQPTIP